MGQIDIECFLYIAKQVHGMRAHHIYNFAMVFQKFVISKLNGKTISNILQFLDLHISIAVEGCSCQCVTRDLADLQIHEGGEES